MLSGCRIVSQKYRVRRTGSDRDAVVFSGTLAPIRDFELVLELTYQALIIPGWIIQPDFQFVHHPGGGRI